MAFYIITSFYDKEYHKMKQNAIFFDRKIKNKNLGGENNKKIHEKHLTDVVKSVNLFLQEERNLSFVTKSVFSSDKAAKKRRRKQNVTFCTNVLKAAEEGGFSPLAGSKKKQKGARSSCAALIDFLLKERRGASRVSVSR